MSSTPGGYPNILDAWLHQHYATQRILYGKDRTVLCQGLEEQSASACSQDHQNER